jgi:folate/biopterin transporter
MLIRSPWFGRPLDPELLAIATIYGVQGALGLSHLAISFFFKDELGLSPAQVSSLVGIAMVPWMVKPLYGFISDGFPLFGYRRRSYLLLSSLLGITAWLWLGTAVTTTAGAIAAIALGSFAVAFSDAIIDALVVQRARQESAGDAGSLQAFGWAAVSVGGILSAYFSGYLLEHFGVRFVFLITALLPLVSGIASLAIADPPVSSAPTPKPSWGAVGAQIAALRRAVGDQSIWLPAAFVFLWQATPSADSAFFYFTTNELHFNPEFLGTVRFFTNIAGLVGVWIFQRFLRDVPLRRIFFWTTLLSVLLGLTSLLLVTHTNRALGIGDRWFSLGDSLILTIAGRIAFMPVLVLAARLCPVGIEATLFALLMSVLNVSSLCSAQLGALLTHLFGVTETDFSHLWQLVLVTNLSSLLPLPLIHWLPEQSPAAAKVPSSV